MGGIAKAVGKFIPFVGPALGIAEGIAGLIGKKGYKQSRGRLMDIGESQAGLGDYWSQQGKSALSAVTGYLQPLVGGDPAALARATASGSADLARQTQTLTDRYQRTLPRSGASAMLVGQLGQKQMSAGLQRQIEAQQNAVSMLGNIGTAEAGMGLRGFEGAAGTFGGAAGMDLGKTGMDRDYYGKVGGGLTDILLGKSPQGKGTLLDQIVGLWKKKPQSLEGARPPGPWTPTF